MLQNRNFPVQRYVCISSRGPLPPLDLELYSRATQEVFVRLGAEYAFDILHTFPFSSETKRMGIIVSVVATGKKFFILKGADNVSSHLSLG